MFEYRFCVDLFNTYKWCFLENAHKIEYVSEKYDSFLLTLHDFVVAGKNKEHNIYCIN